MTHEEAIKILREAHDNALFSLRTALETICPELAESEDDRIRKIIRLALIASEDELSDFYKVHNISRKECTDWLEKQKVNTEGDFGRGYDCGYECCLNSHGAEWFEKQKEPSLREFIDDFPYSEQKEQKPVEWRDDIIRKAVKEVGLTQHQINWLKTNVFPPKQEWSEEDENAITTAIRACRYMTENFENSTKQYEDAIERLKSLRPQPKKELSIEKAIQWLDDTFYFLDNSSGRGRDCEITTNDFDSLEEMYDSFRKAVIVDSEPSWKPSEEQLNYVNWAYSIAVAENDTKAIEVLGELHNTLLNLM